MYLSLQKTDEAIRVAKSNNRLNRAEEIRDQYMQYLLHEYPQTMNSQHDAVLLLNCLISATAKQHALVRRVKDELGRALLARRHRLW